MVIETDVVVQLEVVYGFLVTSREDSYPATAVVGSTDTSLKKQAETARRNRQATWCADYFGGGGTRGNRQRMGIRGA